MDFTIHIIVLNLLLAFLKANLTVKFLHINIYWASRELHTFAFTLRINGERTTYIIHNNVACFKKKIIWMWKFNLVDIILQPQSIIKKSQESTQI